MIPLVSIFHLVVLPFLIFVTFRLYLSFQKTKEKNVGYFCMVFLTLTIMEVLLATPGLVFKSLLKIDTIFALYPLFALLSLGFFCAIAFSIMKTRKTEIFFLLAIFLTAVAVTAINLSDVQPAITHQDPPFIYWEDTRGLPMNIFLGAISGLLLCFLILFFFINGLKSSEKYVRIRSFLISGGTVSMLLAAIINFVIGSILRQHITSLISVTLVIMGSVCIFIGVRYKIS